MDTSAKDVVTSFQSRREFVLNYRDAFVADVSHTVLRAYPQDASNEGNERRQVRIVLDLVKVAGNFVSQRSAQKAGKARLTTHRTRLS